MSAPPTTMSARRGSRPGTARRSSRVVALVSARVTRCTSSALRVAPLTCCSGGSSRRARAISAMLTIVPELPTVTAKPWTPTMRTTGSRKVRM